MQIIIIGVFLYLTVLPIVLKYINIYIYNMSFIGVTGTILVLTLIVMGLDKLKCHIFIEKININIPSKTWAQISNFLVYLLCLSFGISYQILTVVPTLTSATI